MAKILVVDDTRLIQNLTKMTLVKVGFAVSVASNGQEALDKIKVDRPDLIILDIMMPVMDGFEVCRRLKEDSSTQDIPVIFLTAKGQEADRTKGLEYGAVDFITKPFSPRKLIEKINKYLI